MDTAKVAKILDVPYYKIDYLVRRGIVNPDTFGKGKARQFDFIDVVLSALAILLRQDGYQAQEIRQAIDLVKNNYDVSMDNFSITRLDDGFEFSKSKVMRNVKDRWIPVLHLPKYHYGVADIAQDLRQRISEVTNKNDDT